MPFLADLNYSYSLAYEIAMYRVMSIFDVLLYLDLPYPNRARSRTTQSLVSLNSLNPNIKSSFLMWYFLYPFQSMVVPR